jgi:hypothetical protein
VEARARGDCDDGRPDVGTGAVKQDRPQREALLGEWVHEQRAGIARVIDIATRRKGVA